MQACAGPGRLYHIIMTFVPISIAVRARASRNNYWRIHPEDGASLVDVLLLLIRPAGAARPEMGVTAVADGDEDDDDGSPAATILELRARLFPTAGNEGWLAEAP